MYLYVYDILISAVTEDHSELLNSGPSTGKEECRVHHEADCARSLAELDAIVSAVNLIVTTYMKPVGLYRTVNLCIVTT